MRHILTAILSFVMNAPAFVLAQPPFTPDKLSRHHDSQYRRHRTHAVHQFSARGLRPVG